jgi:anaerobic magnesium-protoporphyrin IX monomethyl ester cyclase
LKEQINGADITILNLNMLYIRYAGGPERERHVPLGPLYLTRALEEAGFKVDFKDYQLAEYEDIFEPDSILDFISPPAPIIGVSVMANLLPFAILSLKAIKERYPEITTVLAGVGPNAVERLILERFSWIDIVHSGEGERSGPKLVAALKNREPLATVPGIHYRAGSSSLAAPVGRDTCSNAPLGALSSSVPPIGESSRIVYTGREERITDLDSLPLPAFDHIDLADYEGYGMMTSRGCPYPCTFCSVAPVWDRTSYFRSVKSIIEEMEYLHRKIGVQLFLFQDEFFLSGRERILEFTTALKKAALPVKWKAFGRINLVDDEMMRLMSETGCVELRFGIESGSDRVLDEVKKGFHATEAVNVVARAVKIFPRVDVFFVWGFPFETIDDFYASLFQMVSFRAMGARVLPSLLCLLPQTDLYRKWKEHYPLEFCPELFPEYMITGHEICHVSKCEIDPKYSEIYSLITGNPEIFPGFFHMGLRDNVMRKLALLKEYGFYPSEEETEIKSCGAHSPEVARAGRGLATRV